MGKVKNKPLDTKLANQWAQDAHLLFLDALMSESRLLVNQIAFHGGTSLYLSWQSARFSEDLDFLVRNDVKDLDIVFNKAFKKVQESFFAIDPNFKLEMKNKTKDSNRMDVVEIHITYLGYLGKAMIKAEFWKVEPGYLDNYPIELKTPKSINSFRVNISNPIPVASIATAYCDKLTAFATRPYLKWRDIYDLWWIGTQKQNDLPEIAEIAKQFLHNVSAYTTIDNAPPSLALLKFTEKDQDEIFNLAETDLKKWLPENLWERLYPDEVRKMILYVNETLKNVSNVINYITEDNDHGPR
jgi:predicted nucleotidyltransferase component of viral defense system